MDIIWRAGGGIDDKKEKEIEAEKVLEEQAETVKPRRGRPRKVEVDKSLENTELAEEKRKNMMKKIQVKKLPLKIQIMKKK